MQSLHKQFFLFLSLLFTFSQTLFSQKDNDKLFLVREEVVKVDQWDKYESTSKQWLEFMTNGGLNLPYISATQRDDGRYYYLIPLNAYSEIDNLSKIFGAAIEKAGPDKYKSLMAENEGSILTHRDYVLRYSSEYSYVPKEPRLKMEDVRFTHFTFFKFKLEKRNELLGVLREWKSLFESENINSGYNIWMVELGLDNDLMILTEYFKDGEDYHKTVKEIESKIKEEEKSLWAKMSLLLTEIEQKYGWIRPDLSYTKK